MYQRERDRVSTRERVCARANAHAEANIYTHVMHMPIHTYTALAVAQWLRASNIFRQLCSPTSEWRGFESRWFCRSGFEIANTQLSILNH